MASAGLVSRRLPEGGRIFQDRGAGRVIGEHARPEPRNLSARRRSAQGEHDREILAGLGASEEDAAASHKRKAI